MGVWPRGAAPPGRVAELTEGQRGRMATWAQEWTTRGLATGPVDRAAVKDAIRECYRLAGSGGRGGWCRSRPRSWGR
jgi:hypothetical protein